MNFTNASLNGNAYLWDFGNGHAATAESPAVVYATPGTYPVTLVAQNLAGCSDSTRFEFIVVNENLCLVHSQFVYPYRRPDERTVQTLFQGFRGIHAFHFDRPGATWCTKARASTGLGTAKHSPKKTLPKAFTCTV